MSRFTLLVCLAAFVATIGCGGDTPTSPTQPRGEYQEIDIRVGTGTVATSGRPTVVHYTLWLYDPNGTDRKGTRLESSLDAGTPLTVNNNVITGFARGIVGMRVGGLRRVIVPPELAYGSQGQGRVPPNATIVFEIKLLQVN